jgi:predicted PurR-regulated permease PerM
MARGTGGGTRHDLGHHAARRPGRRRPGGIRPGTGETRPGGRPAGRPARAAGRPQDEWSQDERAHSADAAGRPQDQRADGERADGERAPVERPQNERPHGERDQDDLDQDDLDGDEPDGDEGSRVPRWLQTAAGWSWRLLLVGLLVYVSARIASTLRLVVLPCVAALLLTALLQPLTARLKRAGVPGILAAWCALLAAIAVIAGLGTLIGVQVSAEYPTLVKDVTHSGHQLQTWLAGPPFHIRQMRLQQLVTNAINVIKAHQSQVAGTVLTGGKYIIEIVAGSVLTLFVGFFLIKDGERIWGWLTGFLSPGRADRADRAGRAAWQVLVRYVRGTVLIAAIHSVVIGLTLWILGVPLLVPLAAVVFLAAFVPLIGILVAGTLAIGVTLGTRGWIAAVILLAVFVLENQLDGHLLQPQVVGRILRLHPLAVILVLAVGGVLAGIPGAVVAVPTAAAIARAWPELRRRPDPAAVARRARGSPHPADSPGDEHVQM